MLTYEYSKVAEQTMIYPRQHAVAYPCLGLVDEITEVSEASPAAIKEEIGDALWYVNAVAKENGLLFTDLFTEFKEIELLPPGHSGFIWLAYTAAGKICGVVKKRIRDNSRNDIVLVTNLRIILQCLASLCELYGFTLADAAKANNEKLLSRQARGTLQGSGDNR